MTLLSRIDPLDFASIKPASTAIAEQEQQQVARAQAQAAQAQAQYNQVRAMGELQEQQRNTDFQTRLEAMATAPSAEGYGQLLAVAPKEYVEGLKASIAQMSDTARKTLSNQVVTPWLAGANGDTALMKSELGKLEAGYESKGEKDKSAGIRDLIAKIDKDPKSVIGKLGHTLLEAMGPEKFNALVASQKLDSARRKDAADALLAEDKVTPERREADRIEAVAKAQKESALAGTAVTEEEFARRQQQQKLATGAANVKRDLAAAAKDVQQTDQDDALFSLKGREQTAKTLLAEANAGTATREADARTAISEAEAAARTDALKREKEAKEQSTLKTKAEIVALGIAANKMDGPMREVALKDFDEGKAAEAKARVVRDIKAGYEKLKPSWRSSGVGAEFYGWWKTIRGTEDKESELRKLAKHVLTGDVIDRAQAIRPVSNEDTAMLREGLPSPTGNEQRIIKYMDTLGRVLDDAAAYKLGRSAWITNNKGPENAQKDFEVNGRKVKAGTSLADFLARSGEAKAVLAAALDPNTPPALRAKILAKLKADGEDTGGR